MTEQQTEQLEMAKAVADIVKEKGLATLTVGDITVTAPTSPWGVHAPGVFPLAPIGNGKAKPAEEGAPEKRTAEDRDTGFKPHPMAYYSARPRQ